MPRKKKQPYGLSAFRAARKYETAVKPYHQVLEKLKLPKRGPPGSEENYQRVFIMASAMRAAKWSLKAAALTDDQLGDELARAAPVRLTAERLRRVLRAARKP